jgi:hypothetical protein
MLRLSHCLLLAASSAIVLADGGADSTKLVERLSGRGIGDEPVIMREYFFFALGLDPDVAM